MDGYFPKALLSGISVLFCILKEGFFPPFFLVKTSVFTEVVKASRLLLELL